MPPTASSIHVSSEIGPLRRVIVHRPDEGIARISPKRAEELLFDDIVHLPRMQEEHDIFTRVLKAFIGEENVLETGQLIHEALNADAAKRREVIERIIDYEELPQSSSLATGKHRITSCSTPSPILSLPATLPSPSTTTSSLPRPLRKPATARIC